MSDFHGFYQQRLDSLQLPLLELRRLHIDLIWAYKIIHGLVDLDSADFFQFSTSQTRGHTKKLYPKKSYSWLSGRVNFFSSRIISLWNSLPDDVVTASSLSEFKSKMQSVDFTPFLKFNRHF